MDESTDIGGIKELIIYIKYFDWTENVIQTQFLALIKLSEFSAKAMKQIVCSKFFSFTINKLKDYLQGLGFVLEYLVGIGFDNTNVNVGSNGGFGVLM